MGNLVSITTHQNYVPTKVRAELFYGIDCNLDETARSLYHFLLGVSTINFGITYIKWATMDDAIFHLASSEWGKGHSTATIKGAFYQLRKNRYLRYTYNRELEARVLQLVDYIGENAKD
jgi:hypothetical protein